MATDDNAEIRNLDARLFEKSTCWHTRYKTSLIAYCDLWIIIEVIKNEMSAL